MASRAPDDDTILRELVARAQGLAETHPQFRSLAGARQYRLLYRLVRAHVPAGARVLDWGTGNGHFSYFLTRAGYRPTGFSIDGVSHAGWVGEPYEHFVGGSRTDPVTLPFADASFDAVGSVGVLEHVRETGGSEAASLAEIARVLRPGGIFVAYHFPNRWSWIEAVSRRIPGKHRHVYRYDRADIARLSAEAGLDLVFVRRYGLLPRNTVQAALGPLRAATWTANVWDALDATLGFVLAPLAQNWAFVARKPAERYLRAA